MPKIFVTWLTCITFIASFLSPYSKSWAETSLNLPEPGMMVNVSSPFEPLMIKGLKIHPENPFQFDFIIDPGDTDLNANKETLKEVSNKLIKYFLTAMTVPEKDLWVNLSPYEKNRMIPGNLGKTEMGRDLLAQDYILKQLTASLIYPEKDLGKSFWEKVYAKAQQVYGTTNIPVDTFNKVWIVADQADVFERGQVAYVVKAHLKVMMEEDYLALSKSEKGSPLKSKNESNHAIASEIVREVIIPEIEHEVNTGKNFAPLRQMFYSMILASWYKMALKDALISQIYADQSKVRVGINQADAKVNEEIFNQYLKAYKKGVFNYIKEEKASTTNTPRKYFSGGFDMAMLQRKVNRLATLPENSHLPNHFFIAGVEVSPQKTRVVQAGTGAFPSHTIMLFFPSRNDSYFETVEALRGYVSEVDTVDSAIAQLGGFTAVMVEGTWLNSNKEEGLKLVEAALDHLKRVTVIGSTIDSELMKDLQEVETKARRKHLGIYPINFAQYTAQTRDYAMTSQDSIDEGIIKNRPGLEEQEKKSIADRIAFGLNRNQIRPDFRKSLTDILLDINKSDNWAQLFSAADVSRHSIGTLNPEYLRYYLGKFLQSDIEPAETVQLSEESRQSLNNFLLKARIKANQQGWKKAADVFEAFRYQITLTDYTLPVSIETVGHLFYWLSDPAWQQEHVFEVIAGLDPSLTIAGLPKEQVAQLVNPQVQKDFYNQTFQGNKSNASFVAMSDASMDPQFRKHYVKQLMRSIKPGQKLLSVGEGIGDVALDLMKEGVDVSAIDISEANTKTALSRGVHQKVGDAARLSEEYPAQSFDAILFSESIGAMPLNKVMTEAFKVLKPAGRILISATPQTKSLQEDSVKTRFLYYSSEEIKQALGGAGFSDIVQQPVYSGPVSEPGETPLVDLFSASKVDRDHAMESGTFSSHTTMLFFPSRNDSYFETVGALKGYVSEVDTVDSAVSQLGGFTAVMVEGNWLNAHREEGLRLVWTALDHLKRVTVIGSSIDEGLFRQLQEMETSARKIHLGVYPINFARYTTQVKDYVGAIQQYPSILQAADAAMLGLKGKKILIVDDQGGLRRIIKESVEKEGAVVAEAKDGKDALKVLKGDGRFDLVLTDLNMPNMNGVELYREVQKSYPNIKIAVWSSLSDLSSGKSTGVRIFEKGVDFEKIIEEQFPVTDQAMEAKGGSSQISDEERKTLTEIFLSSAQWLERPDAARSKLPFGSTKIRNIAGKLGQVTNWKELVDIAGTPGLRDVLKQVLKNPEIMAKDQPLTDLSRKTLNELLENAWALEKDEGVDSYANFIKGIQIKLSGKAASIQTIGQLLFALSDPSEDRGFRAAIKKADMTITLQSSVALLRRVSTVGDKTIAALRDLHVQKVGDFVEKTGINLQIGDGTASKIREFLRSQGLLDQQQDTKGGIDLDRNKMQLNVSQNGEGVSMRFDPALLDRIKKEGFDGLDFKIQSIVPMTNLPVFLGLN